MANTFKATVRLLKIDVDKYEKALADAVNNEIKEAAKEWLRAVVLRVPVYSGMAMGSFLPLAVYLSESINISPVVTDRSLEGERMGSYKFYRRGTTHVFAFNTEVPHFLINEFHVGLGMPPLRHPTPWHSFDAGYAAFFDYLNKNLKSNVPKISDFMTGEESSG